MTHLDYDHESPVWRHWTEDIAAERTLLRYDERGCGMSDWDVDRFDFDAWVEDLEAVVDSAGLDRFPLLGVSQGGAVAVAFAVRHPERVSRMVLYGSYARGRRVRAADAGSRDEAALDIELARIGWGRDDPSFRQVFTSQFLPDGSRADWDEFNELLRRTTSPENAVRFLETFAQIDVTGEAPKVSCPTLVVHARDDHRVPASAARELAALIPGSRFVLLPGRNHLLRRDEPAWPQFLAELDRFLADVDEALAAPGSGGDGGVEQPGQVGVQLVLGHVVLDRLEVVVLGDVEDRAEHESYAVDRLHERGQLLVAERHLLARAVEHPLDGVDGGQPAGDELVAHQPLVLGLPLGIIGVDDREQPGGGGRRLGGPEQFAQLVEQAGDQAPARARRCAARTHCARANAPFSATVRRRSTSRSKPHSSCSSVAHRPCSWRRKTCISERSRVSLATTALPLWWTSSISSVAFSSE